MLCRFISRCLNQRWVQITWSRLFDAGHVCSWLVAEKQGATGWQCTFQRYAKFTARADDWIVLKILFVVPDHRSDGTMLSLILAVQTGQGTRLGRGALDHP